ncbi:MAG: hypothetical protein AAF901_14050 [Bacteroidota bacterium]
MTIVNSPKFYAVHEQHSIALGELYFFENYFVAEFKEGANIGFENFTEARLLINDFYKDRPFGFVANRINSYSIILTEAEQFNKTFPNLMAYAIVSYTSISEKVFEIENHFFKFNRQLFKELSDAINWVEDTLSIN